MKRITLDPIEKALVNGLKTLELQHVNTNDDAVYYCKWVNYGYFPEGVRQQYLVFRYYVADGFINVWIDKTFSEPNSRDIVLDIGNGFIHDSIRKLSDLYRVLEIVALALFQ